MKKRQTRGEGEAAILGSLGSVIKPSGIQQAGSINTGEHPSWFGKPRGRREQATKKEKGPGSCLFENAEHVGASIPAKERKKKYNKKLKRKRKAKRRGYLSSSFGDVKLGCLI